VSAYAKFEKFNTKNFIEKIRIGAYTIYCIVPPKSSCRNKGIGFWDTFYLSLALKVLLRLIYIAGISSGE